ncbi:hypothetical protein H0H93_014688 [Arthromyces matolae]|nr:hypothetical protein H0H93_014688 [Arthromyces matolae]
MTIKELVYKIGTDEKGNIHLKFPEALLSVSGMEHSPAGHSGPARAHPEVEPSASHPEPQAPAPVAPGTYRPTSNIYDFLNPEPDSN